MLPVPALCLIKPSMLPALELQILSHLSKKIYSRGIQFVSFIQEKVIYRAKLLT